MSAPEQILSNHRQGHRQYSMAGLSLIELIIFIIIIGIVTAGVLTGYNRILTATTAAGDINQAALLARQRLELILPQRHQLGFNGLSTTTFDPCTSLPASTQPVCTNIPAGYNITTSLSGNWSGNTAYRVIRVDVSGPSNARLQALVADY